MAFNTLNLGLELTLPTNGTTNWGTTLLNTTWTKISQHSHTGSGDGNQIPTGGITNEAITSAKLAKHIAGTQAATLTPAGTTETIDFDNGNIQQLDLGSATGDVTVTLSSPQAGAWYTIWITQASAARSITWPGTVKWPQGQAPLLSSGDDEIDMVRLYYTGTEYRGLWELDFS